ncbi:MAG: aldehyde dehydrogenase family protein [Cyanobacteriota/Melainabacteria group bacterium]
MYCRCSGCFRYYAGLATKPQGEIRSILGTAGNINRQRTDWGLWSDHPRNYPLLMAAWSWLRHFAGNTRVLKPGIHPLTAIMLAEILQEAGLPNGVVNIAPGWRVLMWVM